jgi:hypothetical protein
MDRGHCPLSHPRGGIRLDRKHYRILRRYVFDRHATVQGCLCAHIRTDTFSKRHNKIRTLGFNRVGSRTGKIQYQPNSIGMIAQTHSLQHLVIYRYDWLAYDRSHAWNVDHEAPLIKTRHLVGEPPVPRDDDRAALNIYASQGLR